MVDRLVYCSATQVPLFQVIMLLFLALLFSASIAGPQYSKHPDYLVDFTIKKGNQEPTKKVAEKLFVQTIPFNGVDQTIFLFGLIDSPMLLDALEFCESSGTTCINNKWIAVLLLKRDPPAVEKEDAYANLYKFLYPNGLEVEFEFSDRAACSSFVTEWNEVCSNPVSGFKVLKSIGALDKYDFEG